MSEEFSSFRRVTGAMSSEERSRLVVALDHDVRQPQHVLEMGLRNLRQLVGELHDDTAATTSRQELLQRMKAELASVQAASRQIVDTQQDLIDAIRLEFDDIQPAPRAIRADELISRSIKATRVLALNIELEYTPSHLELISDQRWLERILNNLITNAIRHSGASLILVAARQVGDDIVFEVRDNGRGMTQEQVERAFEPIKSPTRSSVGYSTAQSGFGLYNVRLFAERMSGRVECSSVAGLGTLFRVTLPGPVRVIETAPMLAGRSVDKGIQNRLVAVLDDDPQVLETTQRIFENLGIEVCADDDPLRWLGSVLELKRMPDLFLLDFQLKRANCSLQLDIIRRKWKESRPRIIVVTGHTSNPDLQKIAQSVPVLQKPLSDPKFEMILQILSGEREFPDAGIL
jgi:hypothetical protein